MSYLLLLDYVDYWPHLSLRFWLICPLAFFKCFMFNLWVHTESWTECYIWTTGVDCFNSVNNDQVQVFSYSKYSVLLFRPVVGFEPATSRWFYSETLSKQMPNPLCHVFLPDTKRTLAITKPLYLVMVNRIGKVYPCGSNKGFSMRFCVDFWVQHETPEEGWMTSAKMLWV